MFISNGVMVVVKVAAVVSRLLLRWRGGNLLLIILDLAREVVSSVKVASFTYGSVMLNNLDIVSWRSTISMLLDGLAKQSVNMRAIDRLSY